MIDKLFSKMTLDGDCWVWTGALSSGYGNFWSNKKAYRTHRVAYIEFVDEIPSHLELDHLCSNKSCFNPDHLEAVTHQENINRWFNHIGSDKQCKNGHSRNRENTRYDTLASGRTQVACRPCDRIAHRLRYENNKLKGDK